MSTPNNTPEPIYALKHRIVGAITLVATAVVVIPLLLSEPAAQSNGNADSTIAIHGNKFRSRIVPLNIDNLNNSGGNNQISTEVTALALSQSGKNKKALATSATKSHQNQPENQSGWEVRVGTFSKQANVDLVLLLLNNSGFKPHTTPVAAGGATRVWLGPFANKNIAEQVSGRLKKLIGEKSYVTRTNS